MRERASKPAITLPIAGLPNTLRGTTSVMVPSAANALAASSVPASVNASTPCARSS